MTQEKTFEEMFPSFAIENINLKGKPMKFIDWKCEGHLGRAEAVECKLCHKNHTLTFELFKLLLMENCLDKAKVKEAIDKKLDNLTYKDNFEEKSLLDELKKELGLE